MVLYVLLQYVNLVHLLALSVPFVAQRLRIGFLHLPLDAELHPPTKVYTIA